jgi:hypothetical protein
MWHLASYTHLCSGAHTRFDQLIVRAAYPRTRYLLRLWLWLRLRLGASRTSYL